MIWTILIAMLSAPVDAKPIELPPIQASTAKALPVDTTEPNIPCDQILDRLGKYNDMAREHDASVANFLGEVTGKLTEWHQILSPLEGTKDTIPVGVFAPLQDGAEKITQVADLAWENSSLLANELDRIRVSLGDCQIAQKVERPHKPR